MKLEIKKVVQQEFDTYWTSAVCEQANRFIQDTKWWARDFDGLWSGKKWVVDQVAGITLIGVDALGAEHPSQLNGQDIAVVSKDGSIGLLKHLYDDSFYDIYRTLLLTGRFAEDEEAFKALVLEALQLAGLGMDGYLGFDGQLLNPLAGEPTFERTA